jgi:hypothetical protein
MTRSIMAGRHMAALRLLGRGTVVLLGTATLTACDKHTATAGATGSAAAVNHFVNSHNDAKLADLATHYVDFSFDYPANWTVEPLSGPVAASSFVRVVRKSPDRRTDVESFTVSIIPNGDDLNSDYSVIEKLPDQIRSEAGAAPAFQQSDMLVGQLAGKTVHEFRYVSGPKADGTGLTTFGRAIVLPGAAGGSGVMVVQFATTASGDIKSFDDLRAKGGFPIILNSFKMGK